MKLTLATIMATLSISAFSQDFLTTRIVNERTGESIGVKCVERQNDQCTSFEYLWAKTVNSTYYTFGKPVEVTKVEALLNEKRFLNDENLIDSNRLFALSEGVEVGMLYQGDEGPGKNGFVGGVAREIYKKRGDYQSGTSYVLQTTGATLLMVPIGTLGTFVTSAIIVADVAILPIRGLGKLFKSDYEITGAKRRQLKEVLKIQKAIQDGEEEIHIKTTTWKKIYDGIKGLQ